MPRLEEQVHAHWEGLHSSLPKEQLPWEENKPNAILVRLIKEGKIKQGTVLDIGCGAGTQSVYMVQQGFKVSGIDISETAIKTAKAQAEQAKVTCNFRVGNAYELPYKGSQFDFILDRGCFHHIPPQKRKRYIAGIARVLKKGGKYLLMAFSDKNAGWNPGHVFSKEELISHFSPYFKALESEEIAHITNTDRQRVYLWAVFMERK